MLITPNLTTWVTIGLFPLSFHENSPEAQRRFEELDEELGDTFFKSMGSYEGLMEVKEETEEIYERMREVATLPSDITNAPSVYEVLENEELKERYIEKAGLWDGRPDEQLEKLALHFLQ